MSAAQGISSIGASAVPVDLLERAQWLVWRSEGDGAKPRKVPYYANGVRRNGTQGSPQDRLSLTIYVDACAALTTRSMTGIGFAFLPDDGLIGIDLDAKIDPVSGEIDPDALEIIERAGPGAYVELSPSGTGLHIIARGTCESFKDNGIGIEVFCGRQFFTWTGIAWGEAPEHLGEFSGEFLEWLRIRVKGEKRDTVHNGKIERLSHYGSHNDRTSAYGRGAIDDACRQVADAPNGARNDTLNNQALGIARLVAGGEIERGDAWDRLSDAARACGLEDAEIMATMRSAFAAGMKQPRSAPDRESRPKCEVDALSQSSPTREGTDQGQREKLTEHAHQQSRQGFRFTPVRALLERPEPLKWLIDDYLLPEATALLFGDPEAGKSLIAIDWAASIATGRRWTGRDTTQGAVIYIAGEGQHGIRRRLKAWAIRHGVESALQLAPLFVSDTGAALIDRNSVAEVILAVDEIARAHGAPVLTIIDTLHRNMGGGDENSSEDIGTLFRALDAIRERYRCTVLVVHHTGHGDKGRARGSSSIRAGLDIEFALESSQPRGVRTLSCSKMKDAPKPAPQAFELREIVLPWNKANDEPETSVVIELSSVTPRPKGKATPPGAVLAMETFFEACQGRTVHLEAWRVCFYARHTGDTIEAKRKAFERIRKILCEVGALIVANDMYTIGEGNPWHDWQGYVNAERQNYPIAADPDKPDMSRTCLGGVPDGPDTPL